jgi:hypothetical protein
MSLLEDLFKEAAKAANPKKDKFSIIVDQVKFIEGDTCTVGVYEEVRLNSIISDLNSQFTVYPKLNSMVAIARLDDDDSMFVIGVSEIEKVTIKIGEQIFEMKDGKFTIKSGSFDLKSIITGALQQLQNAVIIVPDGSGTFSPADIAFFQQLEQQTNQLLS